MKNKTVTKFHGLTLYKYFESGYAFEEFLKVYLEKIGLDEVVEYHKANY